MRNIFLAPARYDNGKPHMAFKGADILQYFVACVYILYTGKSILLYHTYFSSRSKIHKLLLHALEYIC
jgi:hypothetical protein